jgi:ATP-dependent Clp protease, protease subunit
MKVAEQWPPETPRPPGPPEWRPPGLPEPVTPQPSRLPLVMPTPDGFDADLASRLLRRRIVLVTGRIDATAAANIVATLLLLDEDGNRPIRLHLSSEDADLEPCALVADTIDLLASPVRAVALGTVGGAALGVLAAAETRTAHPHSLFVLRDPQQGGAVSVGDVDAGRAGEIARQQQRLVARLHQRIADASGRPVEQVAEDLRAGRVLSAAEAVAYGIVQHLAHTSEADGLH